MANGPVGYPLAPPSRLTSLACTAWIQSREGLGCDRLAASRPFCNLTKLPNIPWLRYGLARRTPPLPKPPGVRPHAVRSDAFRSTSRRSQPHRGSGAASGRRAKSASRSARMAAACPAALPHPRPSARLCYGERRGPAEPAGRTQAPHGVAEVRHSRGPYLAFRRGWLPVALHPASGSVRVSSGGSALREEYRRRYLSRTCSLARA